MAGERAALEVGNATAENASAEELTVANLQTEEGTPSEDDEMSEETPTEET